MKSLLCLSVMAFSSVSFASYTPLIEVSVSIDKTIHVILTNDSANDLSCKYSVSWFVDTISFRKQFGKTDLKSGESTELLYRNNEYSRLSKIKAKAICE